MRSLSSFLSIHYIRWNERSLVSSVPYDRFAQLREDADITVSFLHLPIGGVQAALKSI